MSLRRQWGRLESLRHIWKRLCQPQHSLKRHFLDICMGGSGSWSMNMEQTMGSPRIITSYLETCASAITHMKNKRRFFDVTPIQKVFISKWGRVESWPPYLETPAPAMSNTHTKGQFLEIYNIHETKSLLETSKDGYSRGPQRMRSNIALKMGWPRINTSISGNACVSQYTCWKKSLFGQNTDWKSPHLKMGSPRIMTCISETLAPPMGISQDLKSRPKMGAYIHIYITCVLHTCVYIHII